MVQQRAHGGGCCGMKHISGFGPAENDDPNLIDAQVASCINGQGIEVVLNGNQVASYPRVMERLALLGFVLDGHWRNGNHGAQAFRNAQQPTENELGSHNYRFTRADRRQPLGEGPIARRWAGMVLTPGLHGLLPMMARTGGAANAHEQALRTHFTRPLARDYVSLWRRGGGYGDPIDFNANDVVRVTNRASRRFDREFTVLRVTGNNWDRRVHMHDDQVNRDFQLTISSVRLVRRGEGVVPQMVRGEVGQRVQYCGHGVWSNNWNNGEYGTIVTAGWPYLTITFDRFQNAPQGHRLQNVHAQYLVLRDDVDAVPRIDLPPAMEIPAPVAQLHEEAEVLTERPREEAVEPAPTVLFRTYHNVYRDGRTGAGYDSYAAARDARGRDGRVDCREYLSNGEQRLVESVTAEVEQAE